MPLETSGFDHVILPGRRAAGHLTESAIRPHFHPDIFELHPVPRGKLTYRIDGRRHTMCAGDLLLIPPGMTHGTDVTCKRSVVPRLRLEYHFRQLV